MLLLLPFVAVIPVELIVVVPLLLLLLVDGLFDY